MRASFAPGYMEGSRLMNERRATERLAPDSIRCSGGRIIDFSLRGMRISARKPWAEGERRAITLRAGLRTVTVNAICVWTRREGPFKHTPGLAFADIKPETMTTLSAMRAKDDTPLRRAA